jgi:uncharacterized protein (TIGR02118 family)
MHVLTVCYGHLADPVAFDAYYVSAHRPLVQELPGLATFTVRHCESLDGEAPPYHLIAELGFASRQALDRALASPQWQAVDADLANFAHCDVTIYVARD